MKDLFGQSREGIISVKVSSTPYLVCNTTRRRGNATLRSTSHDTTRCSRHVDACAPQPPNLQESIVDKSTNPVALLGARVT